MLVESGEGGGGRCCSETFLRAAVRTNTLTALVCIRGFKESGISVSYRVKHVVCFHFFTSFVQGCTYRVN